MPVVAFAYVRGQWPDGSDENYLRERSDARSTYCRLIQHAVRVAVELGASAVKTTYTGCAETFSKVVDGACGVPVLIAGEQLAAEEIVFERAVTAVSVGGVGVRRRMSVGVRPDVSVPAGGS